MRESARSTSLARDDGVDADRRSRCRLDPDAPVLDLEADIGSATSRFCAGELNAYRLPLTVLLRRAPGGRSRASARSGGRG
jgi:hypothetical protein